LFMKFYQAKLSFQCVYLINHPCSEGIALDQELHLHFPHLAVYLDNPFIDCTVGTNT
jgi:hypothetical protein